MARVLVTGATGLLGSSLVPLLRDRGHEVLAHGRRAEAQLRADLADADAVRALLAQARPDVVVHLAALTNVDACEQDPQAAYLGNVLPVCHVAQALAQLGGVHLVHISTDQVYDGDGPSKEDQVVIRNQYAMSKLAGELAAQGVGATVLRTNFFGRSRCPGRASFTDWLTQAIRLGTRIQVFDDVLFSPLSIKTVGECVEHVVRARPQGIFNLGAREGSSKADFAFAFAELLGLETAAFTRALSTAVPTLLARRPHDMRMDSSRIEHALGLRLPTLLEQITLMRSEYEIA